MKARWKNDKNFKLLERDTFLGRKERNAFQKTDLNLVLFHLSPGRLYLSKGLKLHARKTVHMSNDQPLACTLTVPRSLSLCLLFALPQKVLLGTMLSDKKSSTGRVLIPQFSISCLNTPCARLECCVSRRELVLWETDPC